MTGDSSSVQKEATMFESENEVRDLQATAATTTGSPARGRAQNPTQGYIDLAGETFREEAELADERLFGQKSGQK